MRSFIRLMKTPHAIQPVAMVFSCLRQTLLLILFIFSHWLVSFNSFLNGFGMLTIAMNRTKLISIRSLWTSSFIQIFFSTLICCKLELSLFFSQVGYAIQMYKTYEQYMLKPKEDEPYTRIKTHLFFVVILYIFSK